MLVVVIALACGFTTRAHRVPPKPPSVGVLRFSDDFNGSALDLAKWSPTWPAYGAPVGAVSGAANGLEQACYDPANTIVAGGVATITTEQRACLTWEGWVYPYASDLLTTKGTFSFTYGRVEVRLNMSAGPQGVANWPQAWTNGYAPWPQDGEIDLVEGSQGYAMLGYHAPGIDWNTYPPILPTTGWHTFAVDWRRGSIKWYVDGVEYARRTTGVTSRPQYLNVGLAVQPGSWGMPIVIPATLAIDYVRVYS